MRFYILADLHIENEVVAEKANITLRKMCAEIRKVTPVGEDVLFVLLGDIANKGDLASYSHARICLNLIRQELNEYSVKFEFVPGNHDLDINNRSLVGFDQLISEYGCTYSYEKKSAFSCVYENVNFIFANSNLTKDPRASGQLDIADITLHVNNEMTNVLFCHHALLQDSGGGHDAILNSEEIEKQLYNNGISFFFHGHVHRTESTVAKEGLVEIGCGSISADVSWDDFLFNQFLVGCIQDGKIIYVERWVNSSDCDGVFAGNQLYPQIKSFADPNTVLRINYETVTDYIPRTVISYEKFTNEPLAYALARGNSVSLSSALIKHKKILLLSDAGMGKSIEIKNLAFELCGKMHTFVYSLSNYSNQNIIDLLPSTYRNLSPNRYAILFDGYDELNKTGRDEFDKKIRIFDIEYPGAYIVITSRTNFCHLDKNKYIKLSDYNVFLLEKLSNKAINRCLASKDIDIIRFYDIAKTKQVYNLLPIPFYLDKLIDMYLQDDDLPEKTKIMEKLVEMSFYIDKNKFSGNLEEHYYAIFEQLERVAIAMQMMNRVALDDRTEYQRLFSSTERQLVKQSGLLKLNDSSWSFLHNNFREYLAARYLCKLSQKEALSIFANETTIRANWMNTVSYLSGLTLKWDLLGWLMEHSQSAVVKFEPDRISTVQREKIFKTIFCDFEERRLYINDDLYDDSELAAFACSGNIIKFLIDRIENPKNTYGQYNAIKILRHFTDLHGQNEAIKSCLVKCCEGYPKTEKTVCRLCLMTLCELRLYDSDLTEKLIQLYGENQEDYIRLGMYEYLNYSGEHNKYVQFYLDGIKYIVHTLLGQSDRIGNERFELVQGLKSMSTKESITSLLKYFAEERNTDFYGVEDVLTEIVDTAIDLYKCGNTELFISVVDVYVKTAEKSHHNRLRIIHKFFKSTETMRRAVVEVVNRFEKHIYYLNDMFYDELDAIEYLKDAYEDGTLTSSSVFKQIVTWYIRDEVKYNEYAKIIKNKEGSDLPKYETPIDHGALQLKATQEFFDFLFDEKKRTDLLLQLVEDLGDRDVLVSNILDTESNIERYSPQNKLKSAIYRYSNANIKVADFFETCDIESFIINVTAHLLKSNSKPNVSPLQKEAIEVMINNKISKGLFVNEIKYIDNQYEFSYTVKNALYLILKWDHCLAETTLLQLTEIPAFLFSSENDKKKYEFLSDKLNHKLLRDRLVDNVNKGRVKDFVLVDHLNYLSETKDSALIAFALELCKTCEDNYFQKQSAWKYLYAVEGSAYIAENVFPIADGDLLMEINGVCKDIPRDLMCKAMESQYKKSPNLRLLAHMITLGSESGLKEYIKMVKKSNKPPEENEIGFEGPTEAIQCVNNNKYIPLLKKLLIIALDKTFSDLKYHGLRNSLIKAFINFGKTSPKKTIRALVRCRPSVRRNEYGFRFCNHIINEIESVRRIATDIPKTIEEVQLYFRNV